MDVGKKYMSRIFIYSSTFLGCYLFYAIIILLQFFELLTLKLSMVSNAYALYDIFVVLTTILIMLVYGSEVNH